MTAMGLTSIFPIDNFWNVPIDTLPGDYDIIVTDIMMADVNGIQLLEYAQKKSTRTKVIIITGYATEALAREAMAKGAFDMISKPFRPNDLREVIAKAAKALGFKAENVP